MPNNLLFMLMNPRPVFGAMLSLLPEGHHNKAVIILQRIGKFVPVWAGATLLGMKLHPLAVIFSMLLCVATFGVLGVLVAAPMVAIVSIVIEI